jgi:hypothetical protein
MRLPNGNRLEIAVAGKPTRQLAHRLHLLQLAQLESPPSPAGAPPNPLGPNRAAGTHLRTKLAPPTTAVARRNCGCRRPLCQQEVQTFLGTMGRTKLASPLNIRWEFHVKPRINHHAIGRGRKRNAGKGTRKRCDDYRGMRHRITNRTVKSTPPWLSIGRELGQL